jgi:FkbM family methyltransferase
MISKNFINKVCYFLLYGRFDNFLKKSKGIIHIGANNGEEKNHYKKLGVQRVIFVEANPEMYEILSNNIKSEKNFKAYNYLVTDKDKKKVKFYIANDVSNSSSILELKELKKMYPAINYTKSIFLKSRSLQTIVLEKKINLKNFDSLILDVQGAELKILKGGGHLINKFKYIKLEASEFEIYSKYPLYSEITEFMRLLGFKELKKICIAKNHIGKKIYDVLYFNLRFNI